MCSFKVSSSIVSCLIAAVSLVAFSTQAQGAFTIQFDPAQTTAIANGSNQTVTVDLIITHSSPGSTTLSGFTIDLVEPSAELTLSNPGVADFAWALPPSISSSGGVLSLGAGNFGDFDVGADETMRLLSVDFTVDASVTNRTFPLVITLRDANRGTVTDIADEFSTVNGNFVVTSAVPEPSSALLLSLGFCATLIRRRRG